MENEDDITRADREHLWHPFTQMKGWCEAEPLVITEGRDCFLKDAHGRWYLDGVSSLWVNIHGHRRAELDQAIIDQLGRVAHSTTLGLTNEPAARLAGALARLMATSFGGFAGQRGNPAAPPSRVFYSDDGSTAVEVALKMAFQYWHLRGQTGRTSFLSLNNAYHGDTLGAVSVGGIDIFHAAFGPLLFKTQKAPSPYCYRCELGLRPDTCGLRCLAALGEILRERAGEIAGVIVEPMVQAAGGMIVMPTGYMAGLRRLCTEYGVLLIADEVATGFGRTGRMMALEHEGVVPDIIALSKGLTGGYMPLAATIATEEVYAAFLGEFSELKTFFHGHSYTGNPLGCACALACLGVFEKDRTVEGMGPKVAAFRAGLEEIAGHGHVGEVRSLGLMAGVELVRDKGTREAYDWAERMGWRVTEAMRRRGVIVRPLGNVIVLMPPLAISVENVRQMMRVTREAIAEVLG